MYNIIIIYIPTPRRAHNIIRTHTYYYYYTTLPSTLSDTPIHFLTYIIKYNNNNTCAVIVTADASARRHAKPQRAHS